jgi:hypothetical protein
MEISGISKTAASAESEITYEGNAEVTSRGVCWSTSPTPTIDDDKTVDGTGTGSFVSNLTGLTANTTYYVRAYATTAKGVTYGDAVTFTTSSEITGDINDVFIFIWPPISLDPVELYLYDTDGDGIFAPDDWYPVVPLRTNGVHTVHIGGIGHLEGETYTN